MEPASVPRRRPPRPPRPPGRAASRRRASLCETLDRVLHKGAVIAGDVVISLAGVDLLYLGVQLVLASTETMRAWDADRQGEG